MKNLLRSRVTAPAPFGAPEQDSRRGKEDFPEHLDADTRQLFTVGEVAALFAVSAKTITSQTTDMRMA